jgi:hypothetical protein
MRASASPKAPETPFGISKNRRDSLTDVKATYERQLEDLYAEIGRLTTHVNFLKKKLLSDTVPCR